MKNFLIVCFALFSIGLLFNCHKEKVIKKDVVDEKIQHKDLTDPSNILSSKIEVLEKSSETILEKVKGLIYGF